VLAADLSHQLEDDVYSTADESFRFHNQIFCNLDSTEDLRSFEKYPTPSQITIFQLSNFQILLDDSEII